MYKQGSKTTKNSMIKSVLTNKRKKQLMLQYSVTCDNKSVTRNECWCHTSRMTLAEATTFETSKTILYLVDVHAVMIEYFIANRQNVWNT